MIRVVAFSMIWLCAMSASTAAQPVAQGPTAAPSPALSALVAALAARNTVAYRSTQVLSSWNGGEQTTTIVRIAADPPHVKRFEYQPMGTRQRTVVVEQSGYRIHFAAGHQEGQRLRLSDLTEDEELSKTNQLAWLQENYTLRAAPGRLLGRAVTRVELIPNRHDRPSRRLDIDVTTGVVLRAERIGTDGHIRGIAAFLEFEPQRSGWLRRVALPARIVDVAGPRRIRSAKAANVFQRRPIAVAIPTGFHHTGDFVVDRPVRSLQSFYSDGLRTLVVIRRPGTVPAPPSRSVLREIDGRPVWVGQSGLRNVAHWSHDGWLLTTAADLHADVLVDMAVRTGIDPTPRVVDHVRNWLRNRGLGI